MKTSLAVLLGLAGSGLLVLAGTSMAKALPLALCESYLVPAFHGAQP